jgi:hypothetical protein
MVAGSPKFTMLDQIPPIKNKVREGIEHTMINGENNISEKFPNLPLHGRNISGKIFTKYLPASYPSSFNITCQQGTQARGAI